MNERTFHGGIEHLRDPGRVASLEVERVVDFSLEGIEAKNASDMGTGSGIFVEAFAARLNGGGWSFSNNSADCSTGRT